MAVTTPPDHPDWQDTYRVGGLIQVGTAAAFASANGAVGLAPNRAGLVITAGTGAGGSVSLTSQPSGLVLANLGANQASVTSILDLFAIPPNDTSLNFAVTNGQLWVTAIETFAQVVGLRADGSISVAQGAGGAVDWLVNIDALKGGAATGQQLSSASFPVVPPSDLPIGNQGQKPMASSLPVVLASDRTPALWEAAVSAVGNQSFTTLTSGANATLIGAPGVGLSLYLFTVTIVYNAAPNVDMYLSTVVGGQPLAMMGDAATKFYQLQFGGLKLGNNLPLILNNNSGATQQFTWAATYSQG